MSSASNPLDQIRTRFLQAMHLIQQKEKRYRSVKAFASSISTPYIRMNRIDNKEAYPDTENIYHLCKVHKVNPAWLLFGISSPFGQVDNEIEAINKRLAILEKKAMALIRNKQPSKAKR